MEKKTFGLIGSVELQRSGGACVGSIMDSPKQEGYFSKFTPLFDKESILWLHTHTANGAADFQFDADPLVPKVVPNRQLNYKRTATDAEEPLFEEGLYALVKAPSGTVE